MKNGKQTFEIILGDNLPPIGEVAVCHPHIGTIDAFSPHLARKEVLRKECLEGTEFIKWNDGKKWQTTGFGLISLESENYLVRVA